MGFNPEKQREAGKEKDLEREESSSQSYEEELPTYEASIRAESDLQSFSRPPSRAYSRPRSQSYSRPVSELYNFDSKPRSQSFSRPQSELFRHDSHDYHIKKFWEQELAEKPSERDPEKPYRWNESESFDARPSSQYRGPYRVPSRTGRKTYAPPTWETLDQVDEESNQEPPPSVSKTRTALLIGALWLSVFLVALDQNIIAPAIPAIASALNGWNSIGWYGSAYLLTTCSLQLLYGSLYSRRSVRAIFMGAIALFEVGSLLCALAQNDPAFIIGRAIAGCGCAGIYSGALVTISISFPPEKQPLYTGIIGTVFGIASVVGPLLGGAFTDGPGWRWCFYINLPIGGISAAVLYFVYKPLYPRTIQKLNFGQWLKVINPLSVITLVPGLICVLTALQLGGTTLPWNSGTIIALWVVGGFLTLAFVGLQGSESFCMIPRSILRKKNMVFGLLFAFTSSSAFFTVTFYLPIWFQLVYGDTAVLSGVHIIPTLIALVIVALIAAVLTGKYGPFQSFMIMAAIGMSTASALMTTFAPDNGIWYALGLQILFGAGFGLAVQQPLIIVQNCLDGEDVSLGLALVVFAQSLGGAIFVPVAANRFTDQLTRELQVFYPGAADQFLSNGAEISPTILRAFPEVIPIVNGALIQTFTVAVPLCVAAALFALGVKYDRTRPLGGGGMML